MLKFLFDKKLLENCEKFKFQISIDLLSDSIVLKSPNPFFYSYVDNIDSIISINFKAMDIGTSYEITIYKNTDYTLTMSNKEIEDYFRKVISDEINLDIVKILVSSFHRTKINFCEPPVDISYKEICNIGYCFSSYDSKRRFYNGKTSLVNKIGDLRIEHQIWMRKDNVEHWNKSSGYRFIILNEPDEEIRKMKSSIVKLFYKKIYDKYYSCNYN